MLNSRNKEHIFFIRVDHSGSQWIKLLTTIRYIHWCYVFFSVLKDASNKQRSHCEMLNLIYIFPSMKIFLVFSS